LNPHKKTSGWVRFLECLQTNVAFIYRVKQMLVEMQGITFVKVEQKSFEFLPGRTNVIEPLR
jgi:hypothetical protein